MPFVPYSQLPEDQRAAAVAQAQVEFDQLNQRIADFEASKCPFPIRTILPDAIVNNSAIPGTKEEKMYNIVQCMKDTRVVIPGYLIRRFEKFLEVKRATGTEQEKALYAGMDVKTFIRRLYTKRPITFVGASNSATFPIDKGQTGPRDFSKIQDTDAINDYLTHDERLLSAMLSTGSMTYGINQGDRGNRGAQAEAGTFAPMRYAMSQVGARLEKPGENEDALCMLYRNSPLPPMQRYWEEDWGLFFPAHDVALQQAKKSTPTDYVLGATDSEVFNKVNFKKLFIPRALAFLAAQNQAAAEQGKFMVANFVGLGLGVWKGFAREEDIASCILEVMRDLINTGDYRHLAGISFSWFGDERNWSRYQDIISPIDPSHLADRKPMFAYTPDASRWRSIKVAFARNNPAGVADNPFINLPIIGEVLRGSTDAYDGNSYPGNEFWYGALTQSGDPAAACSWMFASLHNPLINPAFCENIYVISPQGKMAHIDVAGEEHYAAPEIGCCVAAPLPPPVAPLPLYEGGLAGSSSSSAELHNGSVGENRFIANELDIIVCARSSPANPNGGSVSGHPPGFFQPVGVPSLIIDKKYLTDIRAYIDDLDKEIPKVESGSDEHAIKLAKRRFFVDLQTNVENGQDVRVSISEHLKQEPLILKGTASNRARKLLKKMGAQECFPEDQEHRFSGFLRKRR